MALNIPIYRRLQSKFEFLTENVWEIRVPRLDNIEWAIALSCLLSDSLFKRISVFIRSEDNIEKIIENFNPFIDRFSFSQNSILKNIVKMFKNQFHTTIDNESSVIEMDPKVKLKLASEYLSCNIYLLTKDMKSCDPFFPKGTPSGNILLFKSDRGEVRNSFGLLESYCEPLRKYALKNVLLKVNVKEEAVEKVWGSAKDSESFLISILKSYERDIVKDLCTSPSIISKLVDAGFEIDPIIKDSDGHSAFYHALISRQANLCISVYHLGIFCCSEDGLSTRKPSRQVITNLRILQKTLHDDLKDVRKDENALFLSTLISKRIEVNVKILEILGKTKQNNDKKFQVEQQRNILLNILEIYSIYNLNLESYAAYKYYFDVIDADVSLYFFDYIFKLQKSLKLENEYMYATAESSFFIFLLCQDVFNKRIKNCDYFKELENISTTSTLEIPFTIRENELKKINHFYLNMINAAIDENVIRSNVPRQEFYHTLHEYPEIKNYFLIKRLTGYIESALNITENTDWKIISIIIIERVLYVIGEFMKMEPDNDFDIKWFLSLYMPKNARKNFHDIRNKLSHFTSDEFTHKMKLEKNIYLFRGIKNDVISINDYLQPLLHAMLESNMIHIAKILTNISNKSNHSETYKETFEDNIPAMIHSILDTKNDYQLSSSFDNLVKVFENVLEHLGEQTAEKSNEFYEYKLKNIEEPELGKLKKSLAPIKYLLQLFKTKIEITKKYKNSSETVTKIFEKLEESQNLKDLNGFKDTFEIIMKVSKTLISQIKTPKMVIRLNTIQNIENFIKLLKSPSHLANENKENLKNNLIENIREDFQKKDKLINIISKNSTMNEEELSKLKISYMFNKEWREFLEFYQVKEYEKALDILFKFNPQKEFENLFTKQNARKVKFDNFCRRLRLSTDDRRNLEELVSQSHSSNEDVENIKRKLILKKDEDLQKKDKLIISIKSNSTLNEEELSKLKFSYISKKKWKTFLEFYQKKAYQKACDFLYEFNPQKTFENFFSKKGIRKNDFDSFCNILQLSDDERVILTEHILKCPHKKTVSNRLSHLLNRIQLLEKILIDEENECLELWTSQNLFLENHIFNRYMEDENVRIATEMLVLDCMNILEKNNYRQWEKSAGLFESIDLRNVMAHQGIIIQNICEWFDPSDLPKDIVRIVIDFSKDKKAIQDILALFKKANEDFNTFIELLKSDGRGAKLSNEENIIFKKYEKYVDLLPGADVSLLEQQDEI